MVVSVSPLTHLASSYFPFGVSPQVTVRAFRGMSNIQAMKAFMLLGDLSTKQGDELSDEAVKYKERIAFATMRASIPDWQPPRDWNSLTNKQKLDRLNKLQSV